MSNPDHAGRNHDGVRAATIYIARETEALKARVAKEGPLQVRREIETTFNISEATVQRLFESCEIPWSSRNRQGTAVADILADLQARVSKLEQRLL